MAILTGITGDIVWAGTGENKQLSATGVEGQQFTVDIDCEEFDATAFSTTGNAAYIKGIQSGTATFEGLIKSTNHGANGLVSYTSGGGYVTNVNSWDLTIERDEFNSTVFAIGGVTFHAFTPGLMRWGGTFNAYTDDTTALSLPGGSGEPAELNLKYEEKGATDNALSGSVFTTKLGVSSSPQALNTATYSYRGSGALTHTTPSVGAGIFPAGAITGEAATSLTLTSSTGKSVAGSAFWKSVNISCRPGELVKVRVTARFTGTITLA